MAKHGKVLGVVSSYYCVRYHQSVTLLLLLVYGRGFSRTVGWLIIGADPHLTASGHSFVVLIRF